MEMKSKMSEKVGGGGGGGGGELKGPKTVSSQNCSKQSPIGQKDEVAQKA